MDNNDTDWPWPDVPRGRPPLRRWNLTQDSTFYERTVAAPSDATMQSMWTAWSTAFAIYTLVVSVVLAGVLISHRTRRRAFNLYLIFLMIPDVLYSLLCAIQCACLALFGGFAHPWWCHVQSFYLSWGLAANSWLNGMVAWEVYSLLHASKYCKRYFPPGRKRVIANALLVYTWATLLSAMGLYSKASSWWPHQTWAISGLVCTPVAYNRASLLFFWFVYYPLLSGVPMVVCLVVTCIIVRDKLLPSSGKGRELSIYFFRLIVAFCVMWFPGFLGMYLASSASPLATFVFGFWAHAQGAVSALIALQKSDVKDAVVSLLTCRIWADNKAYAVTLRERDRARRGQISYGLELSFHRAHLDALSVMREDFNVNSARSSSVAEVTATSNNQSRSCNMSSAEMLSVQGECEGRPADKDIREAFGVVEWNARRLSDRSNAERSRVRFQIDEDIKNGKLELQQCAESEEGAKHCENT